jgi:threonylcarbamoyladenosine tRNA methylthiotransferase MtaB
VSTFAVKFLGCKVSQADAMLARSALLAAGHLEAPEDEAELHVINTCCITSEAEAKSRQSVRRSLARAHEVYVAGCAVNLDAGQFSAIDERVRALVGTAEDAAGALVGSVGACADLEHDIDRRGAGAAGRVLGPAAERGLGPAAERGLGPAADRGLGRAPDSAVGQWASPRTRGFVKVQDGCASTCAYCIIPSVRGHARSRPATAVLAEVGRRVAQGQPEIVITGISVGDYRDPERGLELGELLLAVAAVEGVQRVRLSSVEVIHVRDSLIGALASEPKVCPHLHIPMQSGDDGVLAAMGRHYDAEGYLGGVARVRSVVPEVNITTDVIVGFPTEDEAAFERTLDVIDAAGITRVHAFSYSPRPGTVAQALGDRVPPEEKKRRSRVLRGHAELRSRQHRTEKLGRRESVLIDKQADVQSSGYTADYTRCYLPAGAAERGELVEVTCAELHADGIRGVVSSEEVEHDRTGPRGHDPRDESRREGARRRPAVATLRASEGRQGERRR